MKNNLKVLIGGAPFGDKNFGEDAILSTDISILRRIDPTVDITVLTHEPERTKTWFGVRAFTRGNGKSNPQFFNHLHLMRSTDVFAFGGTTILSDEPNLPLRMIFFAKLLKKPVISFPIGMNLINSKITRFFIRLLVNKVDLLITRDEETRKLLIDYGVKIPIYVSVDPVFTLEPLKAADSIQSLIGENIFLKKNRPIAAISLVHKKDIPIDKFINAGEYLINELGYSLLFFPAQPNDPSDFTFRIMDGISKKDRCFLLASRYHPEQILTILKEIDLVISSRLHVLIPSTLANVPMIGISRSAKTDNFLKRIGCIPSGDIERITFDELKAKIDYVHNNSDTIKNAIEQQANIFRKEGIITENHIREFLERL